MRTRRIPTANTTGCTLTMAWTAGGMSWPCSVDQIDVVDVLATTETMSQAVLQN
ncbi:hypothetical protein [Rhodopirellula baltica]|uniref:hypothetical protein n=1 Tax=Rhodopirellula baltica TaxID=265606 RepID=UPI00030331CC|nr:hypothetical protein [Rhodopirellula baltica]